MHPSDIRLSFSFINLKPGKRAPNLLRVGMLRLALILFATAGPAWVARAAVVEDLYSAVLEMPSSSANELGAAFDAALALVLVKVSGQPEAAGKTSIIANSRAVVQQYSRLPDNRVRVDFVPDAINAALDRADMPVWEAQRPLVAVWLAVDSGGGNRFIVADDGRGASAELSALLNDAAFSRGLPIVLPLVDAQDRSKVSSADIWGDFREPVVAASGRYRADVVLIGRARSLSATDRGVRWTLIAGKQQASWQGDIASGPTEAAAVLARQLATTAASAGGLRVLITGVDDFATYGAVNQYFSNSAIVDSARVLRVYDNNVEYGLVVRGGEERLQTELASSRLLERVNEPATEPLPQPTAEPVGLTMTPGLVYRVANRP